MTCLPRPVTKMNCSTPASRASSTAYWMTGLSMTGSISFGIALVAGKKRVPRPATGNTAFRTGRGALIDNRKICFERTLARAAAIRTKNPSSLTRGDCLASDADVNEAGLGHVLGFIDVAQIHHERR